MVWGSSAFRLLLSTPVVQSSALGQPCRGWSWPLCAGGEEIPRARVSPGEKSITQQLEEGLQV